ncbi:ABC transporter ATP-binding protein [Pseudonocardia sp. GCM10023141]|uniref:ABC transporter ATP-binding protein n=1 Tax=Pseudonocardia sp. GCM10023141 TaxID=3252653 RepID=UPI0036239EEB
MSELASESSARRELASESSARRELASESSARRELASESSARNGQAPAKLVASGVRIGYRTREGRSSRFVTVVDGIDLRVREGEFLCIVGPSGCGKTTFMSAITGMLPLAGGRFELDGEPITGPGTDRAMVFQGAQLLPWRTVRGNVGYGLEVLGRSRVERTARVDELLDLVGLGEFADHYPHQLSGGMQQRANLARALAVDSDVLLLDEPFAALDAQTREHMQEELTRIWAQQKKTSVLVTHSISEAVFLADRVVVFGPRPAQVRKIVEIELSRPRHLDVKHTAEFRELERTVWDLIESGHGAGAAAETGGGAPTPRRTVQ